MELSYLEIIISQYNSFLDLTDEFERRIVRILSNGAMMLLYLHFLKINRYVYAPKTIKHAVNTHNPQLQPIGSAAARKKEDNRN